MCVRCAVDYGRVNDDFTDQPERSTCDPIDLPPFPALTSLRIYLLGSAPSAHLIIILSSISSVPALTSITLGRWLGFHFEPEPSGTWDNLDRLLVQIGRNATVGGDLVLALTGRREDRVPRCCCPGSGRPVKSPPRSI